MRERREDIPLLIRHFVRKFAVRMDRHIETIPKETMKALIDWYWPGNVRELENLMERSVILSEGKALRVPLSELRTQGRSPKPDWATTLSTRRTAAHHPSVARDAEEFYPGPKARRDDSA